MTNPVQDIRKFTNLPVQIMALVGKLNFQLVVQTPHKGEVIIDTKETHYPFIFGSVTQIDKTGNKLVAELLTLEDEAREYLFQEWRKNYDG